MGQSWLRFGRTQKLRLHEGRQHRCGPLAKQMTSACGFGPVTDSVVGTQLIRHKPCQQLDWGGKNLSSPINVRVIPRVCFTLL